MRRMTTGTAGWTYCTVSQLLCLYHSPPNVRCETSLPWTTRDYCLSYSRSNNVRRNGTSCLTGAHSFSNASCTSSLHICKWQTSEISLCKNFPPPLCLQASCIISFPQVFAWLGFVVAVVWIYSIANEIVNLLQVSIGISHRDSIIALSSQVFGIVIDISDGILGITILAWGNSIGGKSLLFSWTDHWCKCCLFLSDAVANFTMARQGFPRMAIGACFGGPLLSILSL